MLLARFGKAKSSFQCTRTSFNNKHQFRQINYNYKPTFSPQVGSKLQVKSLFFDFSRGFATKKKEKEEFEMGGSPDDEEEDDDEEDDRPDAVEEIEPPLHPSEIQSNPAPNIFKQTVGKDADGETFLNANLFLKRLLSNDPKEYDPYDYNIGSVLDVTRKEVKNDLRFLAGEPIELRRNTFFSISDDLLTELPSAVKAEDPYHEEILQRGRSVMRSLGVDSAFIEQIPDVEFGFSQIEMIGLFDKYMVERLGLQYLTDDPTGYDSSTMGHRDTRLNRPTQLGTFDMWNGMKEKFELEKKAAGKPYPVNLENLKRDLSLISSQQYGIDIKINDFVKAGEAAVAPMNMSPLFDSGDSKEIKYVKQFLKSKGNQEIEQVLTPKFAEEESNPRPLSTVEFLLYFLNQLKCMITNSEAKIIPDNIMEEDEMDEEEDAENLEIDEEELAREIDEAGYPLLHEQIAPEKYKHTYLKEDHEDHPVYEIIENKLEQLEDDLDIYEDPEWDAKVTEMEDCYGDLNYSILQNPVYRRRVLKDKLQDEEPEKVAEKYALQDAKELLALENNIYSINQCFLCKFDIKIEPMNVPLLQRFMNGAGDLYPRRQMKTCRKHQNKVAIAIKRAKAMGIFTAKDIFRIRSPFNDEEVDLLDLNIPVLTVLTEEQADEIEKDRIVKGVYNDYESYGTGIKLMWGDDFDHRKLNEDNFEQLLKDFQDRNVLGEDGKYYPKVDEEKEAEEERAKERADGFRDDEDEEEDEDDVEEDEE